MTSEFDYPGADALIRQNADLMADHEATYLASGGAKGHLMDFSFVGINHLVPTLLLKTAGRRSGKTYFTPLIYGIYGESFIIAGTKGGAKQHPAWFLNLQAQEEVRFQIATQAFSGTWSVAEGEERARLWGYMAKLFPNVDDYARGAGRRVIPIIKLRAVEGIPVFSKQ